MAIISGMCKSAKLELWQGVHDLRVDTIKCALYTGAASLSPDTAAYTTSNEATGTNWSSGGIVLPVSSGYPKIDAATGFGVVAFDSVAVATVTITFRALLIYNASKANRALLVLDRGIDVILTAGPLELLSNPTSPHLLIIA